MEKQTINWKEIFYKSVCQLDENDVFLYETIAELDCHAKDGTYLVPANCVEATPPQPKENHAAKWQPETQTWKYLPDYRGKIVYDTTTGAEIVISELGGMPENVTTNPKPSEHHTWNGNAWVISAETAAQQFQAAKTTKIRQLNAAAQQFIDDNADQVPEFEKLSWTIQGGEAKAWAQNHNSPTPVLDAIATQRQLPRELLIKAALKKTLQYELLAATTAGQRQALQKRIELTQNETELNAVVIAFTLPESTS